MTIGDIAKYLGSLAPLSLREEYDNVGLLTGNSSAPCTGVLCALDVTEEVIMEAIRKNCNCVVAHHPVIFRGLKKLTGDNHVERTVIAAIKNDVAIYAIHTNLDNMITGVNGKMADKLQLAQRRVLEPRTAVLRKLYTFVPAAHLEAVRNALFAAGAGSISDYTECSFTAEGKGTFRPGGNSDPFIGSKGKREEVDEVKLEVIISAHKEKEVLAALFESHPYEEVAYDLVDLRNQHLGTGSGLIGVLPQEMTEAAFLQLLAQQFELKLIRHTGFLNKPVRKVALCGGAGSFLVSRALAAEADAFVTADLKYHEFPGAEGRMLLCDIGHYESEQFTTDLLVEILEQKFTTFAVLKSEVKTNPVNYFTGK